MSVLLIGLAITETVPAQERDRDGHCYRSILKSGPPPFGRSQAVRERTGMSPFSRHRETSHNEFIMRACPFPAQSRTACASKKAVPAVTTFFEAPAALRAETEVLLFPWLRRRQAALKGAAYRP